KKSRSRSRPELAFESLLGLVDGALVRSRGEVLPATVGDDEHDIGTLARLDRLRRLCESGVQDRTARQAGEQAFCVEQLAYAADRVAGPDGEPRVDEGLVVELGHEALVEVAQPVHQLAVA